VVGSHDESKLLYGLVGAFFVVALAFVLASVGTFVASREIGTAAQGLLGNALPSVMELMRARSAQRRLDVDVEVLTTTRGARTDFLDELMAARTELDASLKAAMATPYYPGERELYEREVEPRLLQLDSAIEQLRVVVEQDPGNQRGIVAAVSAINATAKELDASLEALAELNNTQAFEAASRVVSARAQTVRVAMYLEALSSLVAIAAAALAVRAARRSGRENRRRLELERDRANELDVFAQRVAHDLLSPMATISLSLGLLRRTHADPAVAVAVDRASRALERSRRMVEGIYSFSRSGAHPAPGARAPLRATVLQAADELHAAEAESPPTVDVQPFEEVDVAMDRDALGVVVSNLLSNASKFSRDSPHRNVTVRADADAERVHVEIEDTGPGVPPGLERAIFEPYQRAPGVSQPGLGLGLATVQRLVRAHGGALGVRAASSGGAIFWFDLPRAAEAHPEEQPPEQPSRAHDAGAHAVH
jgi:signal transduction histidine kinase